MIKSKNMVIRKLREKLPLLLILTIATALLLGFFAKGHSIFADATTSSSDFDAQNQEEHYIKIFKDNERIAVRSHAGTVAEALERAGVTFNPGDIVEPGLDEEIDGRDYNINIYRARPVLVIDGMTRKYIDTAASNPESVVEAAGVTLKDKDIVEMVSYDGFLEGGITTAYQVKRAKEIQFNYYGKTTTMRTQTNTVGEFLDEQSISVDAKDNWISVSLDTPLEKANELAIYRQGKQTFTQDENIPHTTREDFDYDLDYGKEKIAQPGKDGKKTVTYEIEMLNGEEKSREAISEIVIEEPVEEIKLVGRKVNLPAGSHEDWMAAAGIPASEFGYANFIINHESHWRYNAQNSYSGAYGLCQALPGGKMASAGSDWQINPITQLKWCNSYAKGRYGSWAGAYAFWQSHHWW